MRQSPFVVQLGFVITVILCIYGGISHGTAGIVAGFFVGFFLMFGASGIVYGRGILSGLTAVFLWFFLFCFAMVCMFWVEKYWVRGETPGTGLQRVYFSDKVVNVIGGWCGGNFPQLSVWWAVIPCLLGVLFFVFKAKK